MSLEGHNWIKVKRFEPTGNLQADYDALQVHHEKETNFLIEKCRALANSLPEVPGTISIENGYLCVRSDGGWMVFGKKIDLLPLSGVDIQPILEDLVKRNREEEANGRNG